MPIERCDSGKPAETHAKTLRGQQALAACQCTRSDANATLIIGGIVGIAGGIRLGSAMAHHYWPIPTLAPLWWVFRVANRKRRIAPEPNAPFVYPQVFRVVVTADRLVVVVGPASKGGGGKVVAEYMLAATLFQRARLQTAGFASRSAVGMRCV
jgi:hypothetical protein